ncbi:peptidase M24, structural domain-containing protein [Gautieria morchelliformis]|nr:peptidase M24, structural domain-containing protein [Gautieria morchelliformis]
MPNLVTCQSSQCLNGNPPSRLECPTCNKLGIQGSLFCGQECFKAAYSKKSHKIIHDLARESLLDDPPINKDGTYNPFPGFNFTGNVRPVYPLSPRRHVPPEIPRPDYAEDGIPTSEMLRLGQPPRILNKEEQEKMRVVGRLTREVLDIAAEYVKPGVTTDFIDSIVHEEAIKRGAYPSSLNYRDFPKSFCTSVNEVVCHGIPDQRKLREGDIVNLGFHGDLNETYPVGTISEENAILIRTSRKCLDEAIKICKPGALFRDIGKVIEPIAVANGCCAVRTYTGHGINQLYHPAPIIPHYARNKAVGTMKAGMAFTIEPMINLGKRAQEEHWPDNWTATTMDGKNSAQFEETLLITETGVEVLTAGKVKSYWSNDTP